MPEICYAIGILYNGLMETIILPGYSLRNKEWAESIGERLKLKTNNTLRDKSETIIHHWKHWTEGSMSVKYEVEKILEEAGADDLNIIAKSVGTMIAMHLLAEIPKQIQKVILCGIPSVGEERRSLFKKVLAGFPAKKIIVFQNEKDPLGSYEEVKKFMAKVNPKIKVIKMPRSDHHYPYPEEFRKFLS